MIPFHNLSPDHCPLKGILNLVFIVQLLPLVHGLISSIRTSKMCIFKFSLFLTLKEESNGM